MKAFTALQHRLAPFRNPLNTTRHARWKYMDMAVVIMVLTAAANMPAVAAGPVAVGDTFIYRVINRYNGESRGEITYRVDAVDAQRVTASVSSPNALVEPGRVATYAHDGNWVAHAMDSHGRPQVLEFPAGSPGYAFPLDIGKRWSLRVPAVVPQTGAARSVRVDGAILGAERVRVPAGEFDTVRIARTVYAGDGDFWYSETRIYE